MTARDAGPFLIVGALLMLCGGMMWRSGGFYDERFGRWMDFGGHPTLGGGFMMAVGALFVLSSIRRR